MNKPALSSYTENTTLPDTRDIKMNKQVGT